MPAVSVVIPAYNRGELIRETLASVLGQTFKDIEIVVVDDGSTDNTEAVIATYGERVRYIYQENQGQAAARNTGIRASSSNYIAFLDSDDLWLPNKLAEQMARLHASPNAAWVYCDTELFDGDTNQILGKYSSSCRPYEGPVARQLLLGVFISSPTPVVRRDIFAHVGYFTEDSAFKRREDWEMWLRIAARYQVAYVPAQLARYRVHTGSDTWAEDPYAYHRGALAVIDRVARWAPEVYGPVYRRAQAAQSVRTGRMLASRGRLPEARAMFANAIRLSPLTPDGYAYWLLCQGNRRLVSQAIRLRRAVLQRQVAERQ